MSREITYGLEKKTWCLLFKMSFQNLDNFYRVQVSKNNNLLKKNINRFIVINLWIDNSSSTKNLWSLWSKWNRLYCNFNKFNHNSVFHCLKGFLLHIMKLIFLVNWLTLSLLPKIFQLFLDILGLLTPKMPPNLLHQIVFRKYDDISHF